MVTFHQNWFYVAVAATGFVGLWGIALAVRKQEPDRRFGWAVAVATLVMLMQIGAGLWLWGEDRRPGDGFHVFYGVVIAITFSLAYLYRSTMARRPALSYGLLMLFVMGLGLRAWANVA